MRVDKLDFWLKLFVILFAIVVAIFDASTHSRDTCAVVPASVRLADCRLLLSFVISHA